MRFKLLLLAFILTLAHPSLGETPKVEILERSHSPYNGDLTVLDYNGARYLLAKAVRGTVVQSSMDLKHPDVLTMDYLKIMALMTSLHQQATLIFNLGLGGGELPRFQLKQCSDCSVESAEIDPTVMTIAKKYFKTGHPRHHILVGEGFQTLKAQAKIYDVIWIDAVLPKEGPRAFIHAKDLTTLRDHLKSNGIIVANLGESRNPNLYSQAEQGYKRGYSHGIRLKIPVQDFTETLSHLQTLVSQKVAAHESTLYPSHLIAVGNNSQLTCENFWKAYQKWQKNKSSVLRWNFTQAGLRSETCQDLK